MKRLILLTIGLLLVRVDSHVFAFVHGVDTLRGLTGVYVVVKVINPELGLTKDIFKTDVELGLRMAGIKVLSREEWLREPGCPNLSVYINVLQAKSRGGVPMVYAFSVGVFLIQAVYLVRTSGVMCFGTTWEKSFIGISSDLTNVRELTKEVVDKFINAYLSVNPR